MRPRSVLPTVLALLLTGCNGVPLTTQWKLRHFDLGTADVSKVRVALRAPDWTTPTPEKTVIEVTRLEAEGERKVTIHLRRAQHPDDAAELARLARGATSLSVYEVARQDLAVVADLQAQAAQAKQERRNGKVNVEDKGEGNVRIGSGVACRNGGIPDGPIAIDVYLHPDDEIGWLPLLVGFDLRPGIKSAEDWQAFDDSVPACAKQVAPIKSQVRR